MKRMKFPIALWLVAACAVTAEPLTQSSSVLQEWIDNALPGSEVVVPPGIYQGAVTLGEGITLRSEQGEATTVIDGLGASTVVSFGKESALIGFTVRNGEVLVSSKGNFIGVFENTLEQFTRFGVFFEGGAGVVAHNLIRGGGQSVGIFSFTANPLIINNLIENNNIGFQWHPHLIPTLIGNLFRNNRLAMHGPSAEAAVLQGNLFDGNAEVASFGAVPPGNESRSMAASEFVLTRGRSTATYRELMDTTYEAAVKDHPIIVYDLQGEPGVFDAITLFPWANFVVSASAVDTRIASYEAYDWVADQPLHAEYFKDNNVRPSVRVHNPELLEKMRERYVLENRYIHPASYVQEPDGRRVFRRMTNVSQIEVVAPTGYRIVSTSPAGVVYDAGERPYVSIHDIGNTDVEVVFEPIGR